MKKTSFFLSFLLWLSFFNNQLLAQGWISQSSGTSVPLYGVYFSDANNGVAVGGLGTILHTTNSGTTWTSVPTGITQYLIGLSFANAATGTAVGELGRILRTTNGGLNWTSQNSNTTNYLVGVSFVNPSTGTVVGESGIILRTTNGGTTWVQQTSGSFNWLYGVFFTDANTGTAVGEFGTILRTTNGGSNWTSQSSGTSVGLWGVWFTDANNGTVVGVGGTILRTTNGGASWTTQVSGTGFVLYGVHFSSATTGTVVGDGGIILRTTNTGATWTQQTSGTTTFLFGVHFTSGDTGTTVGNLGTILRTTTGGRGLPTVTVVSPNGGEVWVVGTSHDVTWTSNAVDNVKLEYTTNNGTTWITIVASTPAGTGSYAWIIPNTTSSQCKVRISDVTNPATNDVSDSVFTITLPPSITLSPDSLSFTVNEGDSTTGMFTIGNVGAGILSFTIDHEFLPTAAVSEYVDFVSSQLPLRSSVERWGPVQSGERVYPPASVLLPESKTSLTEMMNSSFTMATPRNHTGQAVGGARLFGAALNAISEIDISTGQVTNSFPTPTSTSDGPTGLAFSGIYLYFTDAFTTSLIYVINPSNGTVVTSYPAPSNAIDGLAYVNDKLYAMDFSASRIYELNPQNGQILRTIIPSVPISGGIDGGDGRLFASNFSTAIYELNINTGSVINSFVPVSTVYGLGYASGRLFASVPSGGIAEYNPNTGQFLGMISSLGFAALAGGGSDWLSESPTSGIVLPGDSTIVTVRARSAGLVGGMYRAIIHVRSNDPLRPTSNVGVGFRVIGAPNISVSPDTLDFGEAFIGYADTLVLNVANTGSDTLHVSGMSSNNVRFAVIDNPIFSVPPFGDRNIRVTFLPISTGIEAGVLAISSNDPSEPVMNVFLRGVGVHPPIISVTPDSLSFTVNEGDSASATMTIGNTGLGTLTFQIETQFLSLSTSTASGVISTEPIHQQFLKGIQNLPRDQQVQRTTAQGHGEWLYRSEYGIPMRNNTGEVGLAHPAAYRWQPNQPTSTARILIYADDAYHTAPNTFLDQALQYLGLAYTAHYNADWSRFEFDLTSGAWDLVLFGNDSWTPPSSTLTALNNFVVSGGKLILHTWQVSNDLSHPLWTTLGFTWISDDNDPPDPVYWWNPIHRMFTFPRLVPQFTSLTGSRYFIYGEHVEPLAGFQALAGYTQGPAPNYAALVVKNDGKTIFKGFLDGQNDADLNSDSLKDGVELWINMIHNIGAQWLSVSPASGTVPPGGNMNVSARVRTEGLDGGTYRANILVNNNDPARPQVIVPARLTVIGAPNIVVPDTLDFHEVYIGYPDTLNLTVRNSGSDTLRVTNMVSSNPLFGVVDNVVFNVPPRQNRNVRVRFSPTSTNLETGTLAISSNDPGDPITNVFLQGIGVHPPIIGVAPDSFAVTLNEGDSLLTSMTIQNTGLGVLSFNINIGSGSTNQLASSHSVPLNTERLKSFRYEKDSRSVVGVRVVEDLRDDYPIEFSNKHVTGSKILILHADDVFFAADVKSKLLATGRFSVIDTMDVRFATPTLAHLRQYDAVLVWSDAAFFDPVALGNVLADYVDSGGGVVTALFALLDSPSFPNNLIRGRFHTQNYWAIQPANYQFGTQATLGTIHVPGHPTIQNVNTFDGGSLSFRLFGGTIAPGATLIASWSDGEPLVAVKTVGGKNRVDLGFFPPSSDAYPGLWLSSTDGAVMMANALEYVGSPNFVAVTPTSGTVPPGGSLDLTVRFSTGDLLGGTYRANIVVNSNDPARRQVIVPARLTVIGAPNIVPVPDTLDFHEVFINYPDTLNLTIRNTGSDTLRVTNMVSSNPLFGVVDNVVFNVPPRQNRNVRVRFSPTSTNLETGTLAISSNDPGDPITNVTLRGVGIHPPQITVTPDSFTFALALGDSGMDAMTISNSGLGVLTFDISVQQGNTALLPLSLPPNLNDNVQRMSVDEAISSILHRKRNLEDVIQIEDKNKVNIGSNNGKTVTSSIIKSVQIAQTKKYSSPTFSFDVAILGSPSDPMWNDEVQNKLLNTGLFSSVSLINIQFVTPTLAELQAFDAVLVYSDGPGYQNSQLLGDVLADYVDLGGGVVCAVFATASIPFGGRFNSSNYWAIAPSSQTQGTREFLGTIYDPSHPILQGIQSFDGGSSSFRQSSFGIASGATRIADWTDGRALVATKVINQTNRADLGFFPPSSDSRSDFWEASTDGDLLMANSLRWVAGALDWLSVVPMFGTVPAGDSMNVNVRVRSEDLECGQTYRATIDIHSNDPAQRRVTVPVRLRVLGTSHITLSADTLEFPESYVGFADTLSLVVGNTGCDTLYVTQVLSSNPQFSPLGSSVFSVAPGATRILSVEFRPTSPGQHSGTLSIASNDSINPLSIVRLDGNAFLAPVISVSPDSLVSSLHGNDSTISVVSIRNTGAGSLRFRMSERTIGGEESFGDTISRVTAAAQFRGNIYSVNSPTTLQEFKSYLDIGTSTELRFVVYESSTLAGPYTLIFERIITNSGTGRRFYSSGPVTVPLVPAKYYFIASGFLGTASLYLKVSAFPIPASFGQVHASAVVTTYPPPGTVTPARSTLFVMYQMVNISQPLTTRIVPDSGLVSPGDSVNVQVHLRAPFYAGSYRSIIDVNNNDPLRRLINLPVRLDVLTGVEQIVEELPKEFKLYQNYPNPFNPRTTIRFDVPRESQVTLKVYNILGQVVMVLVNDLMKAGRYSINWDANNVASGVYFYRLVANAIPSGHAGEFVATRKLMILK